MADLEELAGRLEALAGPDREVDVAIEKLLPCSDEFARHHPGKLMSRWNENAFQFYNIGDEGHEYQSPSYTASIDAAMELVPEGVDWSVGTQTDLGDGKKAWGNTSPGSIAFVAESEINTEAATPALALVSAALRARARTQGNQNA